MKRMAYYTVFVWLLAQILLVNRLCLANDAANRTASATTKNVPKIDELFPVYGPGGGKRPAAFVAGDAMYFAIRLSGLGEISPSRESPHYVFTYGLSDASGKKLPNGGDVVTKTEFPLVGDICTMYFSRNVTETVSPGRYTLTCCLHDVEKELAVNVIEQPRFYLEKAGIYRDREFLYLSAGNVTQGDLVHVQYNFRIRESKKEEAPQEATITVFDHQNHEVKPQPCDVDFQKNGTRFSLYGHIFLPKAGAYRINLEVKDSSTNHVEQYDLPVVVHPPLGISPNAAAPAPAKPPKSAETAEDNNPLVVEAFPTLGPLGGPHETTYLAHEEKHFLLRFRGLASDEDRYADVEITPCLLDSASTPLEGKDKEPTVESIKGLPVTEQGSSMLPLLLRTTTTPGDYKQRWIIKDNLAKKTTYTDVPITIASSDTFALGGVGLTSDKARSVWTGSNLSVGEKVYAGGQFYLPTKSNGHAVEVTISFLDANRKELSRMPPERIVNATPVGLSRYGLMVPFYAKAFMPNRPGSFLARLQLKDLTTQETATKEVPFNVFWPPELPESKTVSKEENQVGIP